MKQESLSGLKALTVLFADDDPETADSMRAVLGAYFGNVLVAATGAEALYLHAEHAPDVMLLDIGMPAVDGLEVARRVRASDADIPLAILSGQDGRDTLLAAMPLGLVDFLVKPITPSRLRDFLQGSLSQLELRGRLRHQLAGGAIYYPATERVDGPLGESVLSRNEQRFLRYLLARRGHVVPTERICAHLTDHDFQEMSPQGLRNLVHRLRSKLGRDAVRSQKDVGYWLP